MPSLHSSLLLFESGRVWEHWWHCYLHGNRWNGNGSGSGQLSYWIQTKVIIVICMLLLSWLMVSAMYTIVFNFVKCSSMYLQLLMLWVHHSLLQLLRIHAFSIAVTAKEVYDQINAGIAEIGLFDDTGSLVKGEELVNVNSNYVGAGFSKFGDDELS